MTRSIEDRIRALAFFRDGPPLGVREVPGGWTNWNWRVDTARGSCLVRFSGKGAHLLGIDRAQEYRVASLAAEAGLGPKVLFFDASEEVLVSEFIESEPLTREALKQPERIRQVARLLRALHRLPRTGRVFDPFDKARRWLKAASELGTPLPEAFSRLPERMIRVEESAPGLAPCLCHNDFTLGNLLEGEPPKVIDWELAGDANPLFDLASLVMNARLDPGRTRVLLEEYGGEAAAAGPEGLKPWKLAFDFLNGAFYLLQRAAAASEARDYDRGVAHHFSRLAKALEQSL